MNTHTAYTGKRDPINCPANQPKPTVFTEPERCPRCKGTGFIGKAVDVEGKPTSASGEWTAATVAACLNNRLDAAQTIADTHNAALAAEREISKQARAAERHMEACRALLNVPDDEVLYGAIKELQQQLSDYREKYQRSQEKVTEYFDLLAAERENLRVAQVEIQRLLQERAARPKMKEGK